MKKKWIQETWFWDPNVSFAEADIPSFYGESQNQFLFTVDWQLKNSVPSFFALKSIRFSFKSISFSSFSPSWTTHFSFYSLSQHFKICSASSLLFSLFISSSFQKFVSFFFWLKFKFLIPINIPIFYFSPYKISTFSLYKIFNHFYSLFLI